MEEEHDVSFKTKEISIAEIHLMAGFEVSHLV